MPPAGYWARTAAGYQGTRPSLPPFGGPTTYRRVLDPRLASPIRDADDTQWSKTRLAYELDPDHHISVELSPKRWHPAVAPIRAWLGDCVAELQRARREEQAYERRQRRSSSELWEPRIFTHDIDRHDPVLGRSAARIAVRVSEGVWRRTLAILNALATAADARGYKVALEGDRERVTFTTRGETLHVTVTEKFEAAVPSGNRDEMPWTRRRVTATGILRINIVRDFSTAISLTDLGDAPLETRLNDVLSHMHRLIERSASARRRRDQDKQERDTQAALAAQERAEQQQRDAEVERQRQLEQMLRDRNLAMAEHLVQQADRQRRATCVRQYVEHVERQIHVLGSLASFGALEDWVQWARSVADGIDPTRDVLDELRAASYRLQNPGDRSAAREPPPTGTPTSQPSH